jgi:hypothetical protein
MYCTYIHWYTYSFLHFRGQIFIKTWLKHDDYEEGFVMYVLSWYSVSTLL